MKKEILQRLEREIRACKKYAETAIMRAREGKTDLAISLLDIANIAKTCAGQAHEELWDISQGDLTGEEFDIFAEAEILGHLTRKAYKEIQKGRK
ncbi:hypothetical protein [Facklamia sp. P12950]|uniref:hypothetical protein n=1 Tax=Facklamia sp. P12950 TaxID=3421951 RepID=UPI003D17ED6F